MLIILLWFSAVVVWGDDVNYCEKNSNHGFCENDCFDRFQVCDRYWVKSSQITFTRNEKTQFVEYHNQLRMKAMKGEVENKTDHERPYLSSIPHSMNAVVRD